MQIINFKITGINKLVMHNQRMADPLDPFAKQLSAISSKRKKTDEDHEEMAWVEFQGSIYHDVEIGPYIPATWLDRTFVGGARKTKRGKDAEVGVMVIDNQVPLQYVGPRDIPTLWKEKFRLRNGVKVQQARVIRTRPLFNGWSAQFAMSFDPEIFNRDEVISIMETAGKIIGIGDWRPRYGRFTVEVA